MIIWLILGLLFLAFVVVPVLRGAPYVPTHKRAITAVLNELNLKKGSVVVDLGSGDGAFLKQAAQRGYRAVGYEINPILCMVAWARCWRYRRNVKILWRDFWATALPPKTDVVFVFLAGSYMKKFSEKMQSQAVRLGRPLVVVSYGFKVPGLKLFKKIDGAYLYRLYKTTPSS